MKLNSSKQQQPSTFVIELQKGKSAILRRKFIIPYADVLGLEMDDRKIILDTYQRPKPFYKKKDESGRQSSTAWSEYSEGSDTSVSRYQIRVVFDSSAEYKGVSLNGELLSGPDLMNSLLGVLLRFRRETAAVMYDIEQRLPVFPLVQEQYTGPTDN